eukprot:scpid92947/ scgid12015/ 
MKPYAGSGTTSFEFEHDWNLETFRSMIIDLILTSPDYVMTSSMDYIVLVRRLCLPLGMQLALVSETSCDLASIHTCMDQVLCPMLHSLSHVHAPRVHETVSGDRTRMQCGETLLDTDLRVAMVTMVTMVTTDSAVLF